MRRQDDWITALYHKEIITNTNPPEYKEGDLYYWEKDQMVMTEHYHKWRGYCCGNQCRHCPYSPPYQKSNTQLK